MFKYHNSLSEWKKMYITYKYYNINIYIHYIYYAYYKLYETHKLFKQFCLGCCVYTISYNSINSIHQCSVVHKLFIYKT